MANVECHTKKGCTPFHLACKEGHLEISKLLHKHGADMEVNEVVTLLFNCGGVVILLSSFQYYYWLSWLSNQFSCGRLHTWHTILVSSNGQLLLVWKCIKLIYYDKTVHFMFGGIIMFWAQVWLFVAITTRWELKWALRRECNFLTFWTKEHKIYWYFHHF